VKRGLTVALAGAAIVVAGISGCSSNKSSTGGSGTSASTSSGGSATTSVAVGGGGAAAPTVIIDGKNQNVTGQVVCTTVGANTTIAIGGAATGISAVLSTDNPPKVQSVGLGNVNGVTLAYAAAAPGQGDASATKDGNTYKITGNATGVDMANPTQPVKKPFEIDVTCS
jgi:ipoprotein LpqH